MTEKCVLVLDGALPVGLLANAAALLGASLGKAHPSAVGRAVQDRNGVTHAGILQIPIPVLQSDQAGLAALWARLQAPEFQSLTAVDFSTLAQGCRTYEAYIEKMAAADTLRYLGIGLYGPAKAVNRLTGSLPLLR